MVGLDNVRPGWIADRDIFHKGMLLVAAGVEVTPGILQSLKNRGISEVEIQADSELADYSARPRDADPLADLLLMSKVIYRKHNLQLAIPEEVLEEATDQMESFFTEIELGQALDADEARSTVRRMVKLFTERSHMAVKLLDIDRFDRYTYRHSLNVGLLFLVLGSTWAEDDEHLEDMAFGAVLHDLGKARVGPAVINKPGALDDEEWALMRQHTVWSEEMLEDSGGDTAARAIARSHHERLDGSGYPDRLQGNDIDVHARAAAICDVYDALTSKRSYKQKMDFAKAIDIIIRGSGVHFDPDLVHMFIRKVGRYPAGSFVRLSTGEVAVVLRVNESAISRPVVSRVLNVDGESREYPEELDLSERMDIFVTGVVGAERMES